MSTPTTRRTVLLGSGGALACHDERLAELASAMAYDERLAERIRELVAGEDGVVEKRMFGGLGFLVGGNMAVAASSDGGILVRVDPDEGERLAASTAARPMEMRGRSMSGWLRVGADDVQERAQLAEWVARGVAYARSLPPK